MGARGPAPTPVPVLKARGSWRAKVRAGEVAYESGPPPCPDWLGADAAAEWKRIVPLLRSAGVLQRTDLAGLAGYCEAWGEFCCLSRLAERVRAGAEKGGVPLGETEFKLIRLKNGAAERAAKMAQQFGFTPASRARVQGGGSGDAGEATDGRAKKFFGTVG
jgi:P27 family predicted phage terminase small subunit